MNNPIYNIDCFDVGNECSSSDIGIFVFVGFALLACAYVVYQSRIGKVEPLSSSILFLITSFFVSAIIWVLNLAFDSEWLSKTAVDTASFWETFIFFLILWPFLCLPVEWLAKRK